MPNSTLNEDAEIRKKLSDILGLETDQDGDPDMLLIRDENDQVVEGIHFSAALDEIMQIFSTHTASKATEAELRGGIKQLDIALRDENWHKDDWGVDCIYRSAVEDQRDELLAQLSPRKEEDINE